MAATNASQEAVWLRALMHDLGYGKRYPTVIKDDNQSCIALTKNPVFTARTKHIDIKYHYVREKVENKEVKFEYCATTNMVADVLTKALPRDKHMRFVNALGIKFINHSQSGSVGKH